MVVKTATSYVPREHYYCAPAVDMAHYPTELSMQVGAELYLTLRDCDRLIGCDMILPAAVILATYAREHVRADL